MITGEQVKAAVIAASIIRIPVRQCSFCGYTVNYKVFEGFLSFDGGCFCGGCRTPEEPRSWDSAADWINMQTDEDERSKIMARFGIEQ